MQFLLGQQPRRRRTLSSLDEAVSVSLPYVGPQIIQAQWDLGSPALSTPVGFCSYLPRYTFSVSLNLHHHVPPTPRGEN